MCANMDKMITRFTKSISNKKAFAVQKLFKKNEI